ncbi:hypothetical protein ACIA49_03675 [Kribbella sp. NPDC051587]|uniref:hypothetical protein n=1 Tax=Kribbella sp. NPDC051587 TaxID=3364119 RepID=UPI0037AFECEA
MKEMPAEELVAIARRRGSDGRGTDGRPQWVLDHRASIESVLLVAYGPNPVRMLRCNAIVFLRDAAVGRLPIHLTEPEYDGLRPLGNREAARLLREALMRYPFTEFDAKQAAEWRAVLEGGGMTIVELAARLQAERVPAGAYSIGVDVNESYCLVPEEEHWHVYYSERGHRIDERVFANESEACRAFLDALRDDALLAESTDPEQ